jgi:hypothetical protein
MNKKLILIPLVSVLVLMCAVQIVKAATIPSAALDKSSYLAGQTGYISVSIYNDKSEKIRVTELSATINYYYADGTVYIQKFFTNVTLPDEITPGQTKTYTVPISLPTNIAAGYTSPLVDARTDQWVSASDRWMTSDHPTYSTLKLYIESPYKQQYDSSQQQLQEQKASNDNLNNTVNILAVTAMAFIGATGILTFLLFTRRPRLIAQD